MYLYNNIYLYNMRVGSKMSSDVAVETIQFTKLIKAHY